MKPNRANNEKELTATTQDTTTIEDEKLSLVRKEPLELPSHLLPKFSKRRGNLKKKKSGETINDPSVDLKGTPSQEKIEIKKKPSPEKDPCGEKQYLQSMEVKENDPSSDNAPAETSSTPAKEKKELSEKMKAETPKTIQSPEKTQEQVTKDEAISQQPPPKTTTAIKQEASVYQAEQPTDAKPKENLEKKDNKTGRRQKEKTKSTVNGKTENVKKEKTTMKRRNKTEKEIPKKPVEIPLVKVTAPDIDNIFVQAVTAKKPTATVAPLQEPKSKATTVPLKEQTSTAATVLLKEQKSTTPTVLLKEQKSKAAPAVSHEPKSKTTTATRKVAQRNEKDKAKRQFAFFRAVANKTKFWSSTPDCVLDPTKEMLAKPCVPAEYGDPFDFRPSLHFGFTPEFVALLKKNAGWKKEEMFIGNRPFWVVRNKSDTFPKRIKVQLSKMKIVDVFGRDISHVVKRKEFLNPLECSFEQLIAVDKQYGIEKDFIEKTVFANTASSTGALHTAMTGKKMVEGSYLGANTDVKLVKFGASVGVKCSVYFRKDRPSISGKKTRTFQEKELTTGVKKGKKKKSNSRSSNSSTSTNSVSKK